MAVLGLLRALFKTEVVKNPEKWKNPEIITEALVVLLLAVLAFFPDLAVTEAQVLAVASGIATLGAIIMGVMSTDKAGLPPRGKVYEKIKENFSDDVDAASADSLPNEGNSHYPAGQGLPMQSNAEPNSVNAGGKGLRGGNGY